MSNKKTKNRFKIEVKLCSVTEALAASGERCLKAE